MMQEKTDFQKNAERMLAHIDATKSKSEKNPGQVFKISSGYYLITDATGATWELTNMASEGISEWHVAEWDDTNNCPYPTKKAAVDGIRRIR
jgi:hypothetical protein